MPGCTAVTKLSVLSWFGHMGFGVRKPQDKVKRNILTSHLDKSDRCLTVWQEVGTKNSESV